ncbi:MAG: ATP-binding cassette domain-containing protein [Candidatus Eisenbacteria bacterium]|nr:ATP-binding cassette domain-containing protein [Candidatus Eisenbacteria bacterium]
MIELDDIQYRFARGPVALRGVSARVQPGEKIVLLGANGTGKSTLLRILDGLLFPSRGRYTFRGQRITRAALRKRAFARRFRREVAYLFQNPDAMLFNPTVREEIAFGLQQVGADGVDRRVEQWANELDIAAQLGRAPFELSGGEKQKVCLAALLALEPQLLLLDEPTAQLDPRSTGWLIDFLQDLPTTTIVTTHNLSLAAELGARVWILSEDHALIHDGPLQEALADHDLLLRANLVHRHRHRHGDEVHRHYHVHDWD